MVGAGGFNGGVNSAGLLGGFRIGILIEVPHPGHLPLRPCMETGTRMDLEHWGHFSRIVLDESELPISLFADES